VRPPDASTGYFALMLQFPDEPLGARQPPLHYLQDKAVLFAFKAQAAEITRLSKGGLGALNIDSHRLGFGFDPLHPVFHEVADRHDPANLPVLDDRQMADSALGDEGKR